MVSSETMDNPLLMDMSIHTIDQCRFITGKEPVFVSVIRSILLALGLQEQLLQLSPSNTRMAPVIPTEAAIVPKMQLPPGNRAGESLAHRAPLSGMVAMLRMLKSSYRRMRLYTRDRKSVV